MSDLPITRTSISAVSIEFESIETSPEPESSQCMNLPTCKNKSARYLEYFKIELGCVSSKGRNYRIHSCQTGTISGSRWSILGSNLEDGSAGMARDMSIIHPYQYAPIHDQKKDACRVDAVGES